MFAVDIPDVPRETAPIVIADARQSAGRPKQVAGVCHAVEANMLPEQDVTVSLGVLRVAADYLMKYKGWRGEEPTDNRAVMVAESPRHGQIVVNKSDDNGAIWYTYVPDRGFVGDDRFSFDVSIGGTTVRVVYFPKVREHVGERPGERNTTEALCKKWFWRISMPEMPRGPMIENDMRMIGRSGLRARATA